MKKRKQKKSSGFTLIELLAVITIMGILMMVAIPMISSYIENARKDTFSEVAKSYVDAVRLAILSDKVVCTGNVSPSAPTQTFYLQLATSSSTTRGNGNTIDGGMTGSDVGGRVNNGGVINPGSGSGDPSTGGTLKPGIGNDSINITGQTQSLMEKGGKSPWNNGDIVGYVQWTSTTVGSNGDINLDFTVTVIDKGGRGFASVSENNLDGSAMNYNLTYSAPNSGTQCWIKGYGN